MTDVISSRTRTSSSKTEIQRLEQKLCESEKANSNLKVENLELTKENANLKKELDLVTSELREIQLKQGKEWFINDVRFF